MKDRRTVLGLGAVSCGLRAVLPVRFRVDHNQISDGLGNNLHGLSLIDGAVRQIAVHVQAGAMRFSVHVKVKRTQRQPATKKAWDCGNDSSSSDLLPGLDEASMQCIAGCGVLIDASRIGPIRLVVRVITEAGRPAVVSQLQRSVPAARYAGMGVRLPGGCVEQCYLFAGSGLVTRQPSDRGFTFQSSTVSPRARCTALR